MKISNLILITDGYKPSHYRQLPPNTENQFFYIESRGGVYDNVVMFGLQIFVSEYLSSPITMEDIDEAEEIITTYGLPFNREGWEYIVKEHGGWLPLCIRAVPEGSVVPVKNILTGVRATDRKCVWLESYMETALLRAVWYGSTVATVSYYIKQNIMYYLKKNGTPETIDFKLHDFGARGVSSSESAQIGGAAHLVNFRGSDTIEAILALRKYYNEYNRACSIPASEHSTISSWGRENEFGAYRNMTNEFGDSTFACVSDTYNIYDAIKMWKELEPLILKKGGVLIIRPDSGDPVEMICGSINRTDKIGLIQLAMNEFGYKINEKGYKVLPDHVRFIQGDGVDPGTINRILTTLDALNISSDNIAFGMGGALLQKLDRDTQKFAMKCSAIKIDGEWIDVYKDPITDSGKASKKGLLGLFVDSAGNYVTCRTNYEGRPLGWSDRPLTDAMITVYLNGECKMMEFSEVLANVNK